jgi:poly-D-alanine transfer protein DltD
MTLFNIADFAIFAVDLIGKEGSVKFNTCMVEHNFDLEDNLSKAAYRALEKEQTIRIGTKGDLITKKQVQEFLEKVSEYVGRDEFQNGRSYFFEGIETRGLRSYAISWGS